MVDKGGDIKYVLLEVELVLKDGKLVTTMGLMVICHILAHYMLILAGNISCTTLLNTMIIRNNKHRKMRASDDRTNSSYTILI